jgi:uncharacterized small protein (DUF1192 family)
MEQKFEKIPLKQRLMDHLESNAGKTNEELADDFSQFMKIGKIESKIAILNDVIKDLQEQLHTKSNLENQAKSIQIALTRELSRTSRLKKELILIKKNYKESNNNKVETSTY